MESTRPIRALVRGLDALTTLNQRNGATVSEIAQQIRLPRTTTYRILETLTHAGYVYRDPADDRYRLTIMVHRLADGFGETGDALLDLLRVDTRVGQAQRIRAPLEQEVGPLDEDHLALGGRLLQLRDVDRLRQLDPHEVAALRRLEARLGKLALQRRDQRVAALAQRVLDRRDRAVHPP